MPLATYTHGCRDLGFVRRCRTLWTRLPVLFTSHCRIAPATHCVVLTVLYSRTHYRKKFLTLITHAQGLDFPDPTGRMRTMLPLPGDAPTRTGRARAECPISMVKAAVMAH